MSAYLVGYANAVYRHLGRNPAGLSIGSLQLRTGAPSGGTISRAVRRINVDSTWDDSILVPWKGPWVYVRRPYADAEQFTSLMVQYKGARTRLENLILRQEKWAHQGGLSTADLLNLNELTIHTRNSVDDLNKSLASMERLMRIPVGTYSTV